MVESDPMADRPASMVVFERIDIPVFALDTDWRFTYVNDRARALLADDRSLSGQVIWDALPGVVETDVPETFHDAATTGETRTTSVPLDEERWVELQAFPEEDGLSVLMQDVTERHRQREERRRYELAFAAADDPIYVLDHDGIFREVNRAMVELTGYTKTNLLGNSMAMLIDPDELDRAERRIRETVIEGDASVGTVEVPVETEEGDRRRCEINVALLPDSKGTVGVIRDVTERHQREQRLAVLDRVLRHNIRNEMNVVMGRAKIAARQADPEVGEHLDKILEKAEDLVSVSQAVRRFSDAIDPSVGSARPREVVDSLGLVVENLRAEYPEAELQLLVREPGWMRAYESALAGVEEVIRNAIEHADVETPEVNVTVDATGPPNDEDGWLSIQVADNGPGLPSSEREVLTEEGETQLTHASGIGLWLVNWAITKSGGRLDFTENEPRGSVVTIELPRAAPPSRGEDGDPPT